MAIQKITLFIKRWLPPIIWAILIFGLSSYSTLPGPAIIWWDFVVKKGAHMFMYGGLFFWIQRSLNWEKSHKTYFWSLVLTMMYAFSDEYHQSFIPGRTALLSDMGFDFLGASIIMLKLKDLI